MSLREGYTPCGCSNFPLLNPTTVNPKGDRWGAECLHVKAAVSRVNYKLHARHVAIASFLHVHTHTASVCAFNLPAVSVSLWRLLLWSGIKWIRAPILLFLGLRSCLRCLRIACDWKLDCLCFSHWSSAFCFASLLICPPACRSQSNGWKCIVNSSLCTWLLHT